MEPERRHLAPVAEAGALEDYLGRERRHLTGQKSSDMMVWNVLEALSHAIAFYCFATLSQP